MKMKLSKKRNLTLLLTLSCILLGETRAADETDRHHNHWYTGIGEDINFRSVPNSKEQPARQRKSDEEIREVHKREEEARKNYHKLSKTYNKYYNEKFKFETEYAQKSKEKDEKKGSRFTPKIVKTKIRNNWEEKQEKTAEFHKHKLDNIIEQVKAAETILEKIKDERRIAEGKPTRAEKNAEWKHKFETGEWRREREAERKAAQERARQWGEFEASSKAFDQKKDKEYQEGFPERKKFGAGLRNNPGQQTQTEDAHSSEAAQSEDDLRSEEIREVNRRQQEIEEQRRNEKLRRQQAEEQRRRTPAPSFRRPYADPFAGPSFRRNHFGNPSADPFGDPTSPFTELHRFREEQLRRQQAAAEKQRQQQEAEEQRRREEFRRREEERRQRESNIQNEEEQRKRDEAEDLKNQARKLEETRKKFIRDTVHLVPAAYQAFGLSNGASFGEIKKEYHKHAQNLHSDKNADPLATERLKEFGNHFEVLKAYHRKDVYQGL